MLEAFQKHMRKNVKLAMARNQGQPAVPTVGSFYANVE